MSGEGGSDKGRETNCHVWFPKEAGEVVWNQYMELLLLIKKQGKSTVHSASLLPSISPLLSA